jgi:NAD(P)-dependent dehydrogenase (short-subunit alcohol dehydrogenase family)
VGRAEKLASQPRRFTGKVVAVTGAARGIGKCVAWAFGREGAQVAVCDIDEPTGTATAGEFRDQGVLAAFVPTDLSRPHAPEAMVRQIVQRWGRLDVLVNNARAITTGPPSQEEDEDAWERAMAVSLRAPFFASQEAIRVMAHTGGGSVVNISSVLAFLVSPHLPASYHIAKAGLVQLTRYLAACSGRSGVRVNAVLPGFIVQDEHQDRYVREDNHPYRELAEACHPMGQVGRSADVATACLFLCSPEAAFVTGQCLVVDGGATIQEQFGLLHAVVQPKKAVTGGAER